MLLLPDLLLLPHLLLLQQQLYLPRVPPLSHPALLRQPLLLHLAISLAAHEGDAADAAVGQEERTNKQKLKANKWEKVSPRKLPLLLLRPPLLVTCRRVMDEVVAVVEAVVVVVVEAVDEAGAGVGDAVGRLQ